MMHGAYNIRKFRKSSITSMNTQSLPNQFYINLPTLVMNTRGYSDISAYFYSDTQFHDLEGDKHLVKFIISCGVSMTTSIFYCL